jgi:UDP-glucuronate 4-epimerase
MRVLVTGAAGFIGMHVSRRLAERGDEVTGLDNLDPYYDPNLKKARLHELARCHRFRFVPADVSDGDGLDAVFREGRFERVVHLAGQAGVRYSLRNPRAYVQANLVGFANVLEACRHSGIGHLVYASSSSVYGGQTRIPFSVHDSVDHPVSFYAATKKSNELMAHSYSHLFGLPTTGLRFFTVYGPWGRPDMAAWLFADAMLAGRAIEVFNEGALRRDFTFIDDIVEGTVRVLDHPPTPDPDCPMDRPDPSRSTAPWRVYNIGNHQPVPLLEFISTLEEVLGVEAKKIFLPMQPGDVLATYADVEELRRDVGFEPRTSLRDGLTRFAAWFREYQKATGAPREA